MLAVATHNFFSIMTANTEATLTLTLGSVSGNKYVFTAPKVQYSAIEPGDRDGMQTAGASVRFNRSSGDDEVSLVHST